MTPERNYGPGMISKLFSYWRELTIIVFGFYIMFH